MLTYLYMFVYNKENYIFANYARLSCGLKEKNFSFTFPMNSLVRKKKKAKNASILSL